MRARRTCVGELFFWEVRMDLTTVVVLGLIAIAGLFLAYFERNSRQNETKLRAEEAAKATALPQSNPAAEVAAKPPVTKRSR
jgi:hypothetical protein